MTDEEAIQIAKRSKWGPIVHIPPTGAVNEVVTVDLSDSRKPVVTRASPRDLLAR